MPLTDAGLTVTPIADRVADLRALVDDLNGGGGIPPLNYEGTIEGNITEALAQLAYDVEERQSVIFDALSPETAGSATLDRHAQAAGIARKGPVASRYTVRAVATAGTVTVPEGTILEGGGDDGRARWVVVESADVGATPSPVVVRAQAAGPVTLSGALTLRVVTPVAGLASVSYDPMDGDPYSVGRDRESDAALRARIRRQRSAARGPTRPGVRASLLDLSWVQAVSVARPGPGRLALTVVPSPVGTDQRTALAEAIVAAAGAGTETVGTDGETVDLPGGETETARWSAGTTDPVDVAVSVVLDSTVTLADVEAEVAQAIKAEVAQAIEAAFTDLDTGHPLRFARVYCAVAEVHGVIGIGSLTLDGGTADVTPVSTVLLVPGAVAVT